jgi:DsbC/DsbD-like thiol-disulfide interchange protein
MHGLLSRAFVFRFFVAILALTPTAAVAKPHPVAWRATMRSARAGDPAAEIVLRARIAQGWYVYAFRQPGDGPTPLRVRLARGSAGQLGAIQAPPARFEFDRGFRRTVSKYSGSQTFVIPIRLAQPRRQTVRIEVRYQACNSTVCLPPRTETIELAGPRIGRM